MQEVSSYCAARFLVYLNPRIHLPHRTVDLQHPDPTSSPKLGWPLFHILSYRVHISTYFPQPRKAGEDRSGYFNLVRVVASCTVSY